MKKLFCSISALILSALALHATTVEVYVYDPGKLLGTEYANIFRHTKEAGQSQYVSVERAQKIISQCEPGQIAYKSFPVSQDLNYLDILASGDIEIEEIGTNMLIAPPEAGTDSVEVNADSGVVAYYEVNGAGYFVLAFELGANE